MIELLCVSKADYMDWMSAIVAILALLIMILIGWQIWNYVYFEKKLDNKLNTRLSEVETALKEEYKEQIILSSYYSYLQSAFSHQKSFGWSPPVVLNNLGQAIDEIIKIDKFDSTLLNPLIEQIKHLVTERKVFESNSTTHTEAVDKFISHLRLLLGKDEQIYDLLREIEKQKSIRQKLIND